MDNFNKRRDWNEDVLRSHLPNDARRSHPGFEPTDPPPPPARRSYASDTDIVLETASKRSSHVYTILGAIGGIVAAVVASVAYLETRPSRQYVDDKTDAVRNEDRAVHKDTDERLRQIDLNTAKMMTILEGQGKATDEIKKDLKELSSRPGRR